MAYNGLEYFKYTLGTGIQTMTDLNISATSSAIKKIKDIIIEENNGSNLRIFVQGGGCAGFNYGFMLDTNLTDEDFVCDLGSDVKLFVDSMSAQYLDGVKIDFKEDIVGSAFSIENPKAQTTCGCGSSFNPF